MLATPETSHVEALPVYSPSEDSFLILDTLEAQSSFLTSHFRSNPAPLVAEVGVGSGVVTAFLVAHAKALFGRKDLAVLALDVNPYACKAADSTVSRAAGGGSDVSGLYLGAFMCDLTSVLRHRSMDLLVFNPPYVPSDVLPTYQADNSICNKQPLFETESRLLDLAVSGGMDGMETTWKLLQQLENVLSHRGVAYVLLCARNRPNEVMQWLIDRGWHVEKVGNSGKKGGIEKLCVVRIMR